MLIKPNILAVAETERQPEAAIDIWVKVFNNGPSKICGGQPLKFCSDMVCLSRPYHFKSFKGCLPQILIGSSLNNLTHMF